jgi:hypothetical protein
MAIQFEETNSGSTLEVKAIGKLTHEDYQRFGPEFDRLAAEHGKLRVLFDLSGLDGWEAEAMWDDLKLGIKHHADLERLAVVGDRTWEKWMSVLWRPFTSGEMRYFDKAQLEAARAWLAGK